MLIDSIKDMNLKFDTVRIGGKRKEPISEKILKENYNKLKKEIRFFIDGYDFINTPNKLSITIIIPGRGYDILADFTSIADLNLKRDLNLEFENSIYKGGVDKLLQNIDNPTF